MADVVYLHVGAPKTGTTYLQDRLHANIATLARHGVRYPVGPHRDMFPAALDLLDRRWGGQREDVRGQWPALAERVRRTPGTVLVSHEILAGAGAEQAARAMSDLGDAELHVVYSARDIARQVPAEWQELVKHRHERSFRTFVKQVRTAERRDSPLWFWRVQGLPDVLNRWSQGLPPERVHLVTVPHPGAPPDELWHRFCRALGIDPGWAPEDAARSNPSLGIDETALLRELNRRLRKAGLDSASYRHLVRHLVAHETLADRPGMRRVGLPPRLHAWAGEIAEEWVGWVEGSGVDVVGDLADLRPVLPEPGSWQKADRPRPQRMVDAALDALVAVVAEAAARPAVQAAPPPLLDRATRRLRGQ
ncbi:MAG: hypothetical protein AVDCRST_MAG34-1538 [uncultured Nocardioidaceae bacterium]|uniref:Sulfotransferase family protein n=1 Tax=uncultured Nocardioidaceae bacterium TaxID=253824 RepID=A0A6J4L5J6_9ACTN|nr:MAG: hypothetical protein AVDCRST_MAG34-1538 [uncultured Nocardioidaceae bacterium]